MSFKQAKVDELAELANFYAIEVEAADPEKGPTKKEILAALASGDEPVTEEDYQTFLEAKASGKDKSREEKLEEAARKTETPEDDEDEAEELAEPVDKSDWVLLKMERKNASYETSGFVFSQRHPYNSVPPNVAKYLVQQVKGFRVALPDEVSDYYN